MAALRFRRASTAPCCGIWEGSPGPPKTARFPWRFASSSAERGGETAARFEFLLREAKESASSGQRAECLALLREAQRLPGYRASRAAVELANATGRYGIKREPRVVRVRFAFEGHTDGVSCVALNHNGLRALSGAHDKTLRLWNTATGQCLRVFRGHTNAVTSVGRHSRPRRCPEAPIKLCGYGKLIRALLANSGRT